MPSNLVHVLLSLSRSTNPVHVFRNHRRRTREHQCQGRYGIEWCLLHSPSLFQTHTSTIIVKIRPHQLVERLTDYGTFVGLRSPSNECALSFWSLMHLENLPFSSNERRVSVWPFMHLIDIHVCRSCWKQLSVSIGRNHCLSGGRPYDRMRPSVLSCRTYFALPISSPNHVFQRDNSVIICVTTSFDG
jgi:hypothetical protein